jgi:hypothetical protein
MPIFNKGTFRPRPSKRNPGRAPGKYDAPIPQTAPVSQRSKLALPQQPQKAAQGPASMPGTTRPYLTAQKRNVSP